MLNCEYHSNKNISIEKGVKLKLSKKAIWSQLDI